MNLKLIIILVITYSYGLFELFMGVKQKRKGNIEKSGDKSSVWMLVILIAFGYFFSFLIASTKTGRIYHWNTFFYYRHNNDSIRISNQDNIHPDAEKTIYLYCNKN